MFANFKNFIDKENYGLCLMKKMVDTINFSSVLITKNLMDKNFYGFLTYNLPTLPLPRTDCI